MTVKKKRMTTGPKIKMARFKGFFPFDAFKYMKIKDRPRNEPKSNPKKGPRLYFILLKTQEKSEAKRTQINAPISPLDIRKLLKTLENRLEETKPK